MSTRTRNQTRRQFRHLSHHNLVFRAVAIGSKIQHNGSRHWKIINNHDKMKGDIVPCEESGNRQSPATMIEPSRLAYLRCISEILDQESYGSVASTSRITEGLEKTESADQTFQHSDCEEGDASRRRPMQLTHTSQLYALSSKQNSFPTQEKSPCAFSSLSSSWLH